MTDQEQELDEEVTASVGEDETDNEDSGEETNNETSTNKGNKSNFKALYKSNKEKEKLLAEKDQALLEAQEELEQWRELNPETVQDLDSKKDIESIRLELFTSKVPEAEPHMNTIQKVMKEHSMDIKTAWKFVKMDIPEESKSKQDFSIGKTVITKNTDMTKISPEDALELSKEDQGKWRRANGWE